MANECADKREGEAAASAVRGAQHRLQPGAQAAAPGRGAQQRRRQPPHNGEPARFVQSQERQTSVLKLGLRYLLIWKEEKEASCFLFIPLAGDHHFS